MKMKFQYRDGRVYSLFGVESVLFKDGSFRLGLYPMSSETVVTNECCIASESDKKYLLVFVAMKDGRIYNVKLHEDDRESFPITINSESRLCRIAHFECEIPYSIYVMEEFISKGRNTVFRGKSRELIHIHYGDTNKKIIKDIMEIIFTNESITITVEYGLPVKYDIRDCTIYGWGEEMMVTYDDGRIEWRCYGEIDSIYREVKFNKEERRISIGGESFGNVFSVQMRSNKPICF